MFHIKSMPNWYHCKTNAAAVFVPQVWSRRDVCRRSAQRHYCKLCNVQSIRSATPYEDCLMQYCTTALLHVAALSCINNATIATRSNKFANSKAIEHQPAKSYKSVAHIQSNPKLYAYIIYRNLQLTHHTAIGIMSNQIKRIYYGAQQIMIINQTQG